MDDAKRGDHEHVLVYAPTSADATLSRKILAEAGFASEVCLDIRQLASRIDESAGVILLTEEALAAGGIQYLFEALQRQPSWSDIPILLMCASGADSSIAANAINVLGNVMILERPVRVTTLISALRSSVRARRRQHDLRARMEALRQSEQRFRFLADNIPSFVWVTAPDGSLTYANDQWLEYSGLTPTGDTRQWPLIAMHPEDRDRALEQWANALREGRQFQVEARCRRYDGVYRWFVLRASPLMDARGQILSWFGVTTDIDEQKRVVCTARFLADASAALAEIGDYESTLRRIAGLAVPDFADWCAVDIVRDDTLRRIAAMHIDPSRVPLAHELHRRYPPARDAPEGPWKVMSTRRPEWRPEVTGGEIASQARDPGESELIRALGMHSSICAPLGCRGSVLGVITFVTGESGRRYTPQDLIVAEDLARRASVAIDNAMLYRELQDAHRRKDEFLATLAHELRNPLAPIRSALQIMRLTGDEATVGQARDIMERQVGQMVRLIDDLLDVSRITRGQFELRRERVTLDSVIRNAVDTARPLIEGSGHRLLLGIPPEPVWLDADPVRLAQVFSNLLNNAAKYMERGGTIWLNVARQKGEVAVSVRDTGEGIPSDSLSSIFDMFTQVGGSLGRSQGGLGIGLTLVKRLVEMHDGTIEVQSEGPGKGSAFTVTLPLAGAPEADQRAPVDAAGRHSGHHRILVADDNADVAESLAMMLRLMGHEVRTVPDGEQAVEQAAAFSPEMILLDIGMPGLDGYEAARRIREQHWDERIILVALTGWGQEEDRRKATAAGFDHHFTKPVNPADLERVVARLPAGRVEASTQLDIEL